uniref:GLOBIN domain-containing protein n=1 Tax=Panagrellus redivivus TaxID=6233 RepID=A0A7E4ZXU0_PANRE
MLRKTYQKLHDPKEVIGQVFMEIVNDVAPELKKLFGVDRAPKVTMLKMPKFGGHVARMADFFEQTTSMLGFTENIVGAWQLVRKTGRLHCKVAFMEENQNQLEKNYFTIVTDYFIEQFVAYLTGEKAEPNPAPDEEKNRFGQTYTKQQISDVWRRFFTLIGNQFTEAFEIERQRSLSSQNKKTLAPHQHYKDEADKKKKIRERQSEVETVDYRQGGDLVEMPEDPF